MIKLNSRHKIKYFYAVKSRRKTKAWLFTRPHRADTASPRGLVFFFFGGGYTSLPERTVFHGPIPNLFYFVYFMWFAFISQHNLHPMAGIVRFPTNKTQPPILHFSAAQSMIKFFDAARDHF
jgi:hypothetical protein